MGSRQLNRRETARRVVRGLFAASTSGDVDEALVGSLVGHIILQMPDGSSEQRKRTRTDWMKALAEETRARELARTMAPDPVEQE